MPHIDKIEITSANGCIPEGFVLPDLPNLTVITGVNNSGKTSFMKAVAGKAKGGLDKGRFITAGGEINPEIVYIAAENIQPAEDEAKPTSASARLIVNLSALFASLGVNFELTEKDKISDNLKKLLEKANSNLEAFTGTGPHTLEHKEGQLKPESIIQQLVEKITANENGEARKLSDLGQGTQRVIIAALLKAYMDLRREAGVAGGAILILFEEPEIYLHPKLKKALSKALVDIANQDNHQVIISTHDPYFAYTNMFGEDSKVVSFRKGSNGLTTLVDNDLLGVEDELLHIHLFTKVMEELSPNDSKTKESSTINQALINDHQAPTKQYKWGEMSSEQPFALPVYIRHLIHHPLNNVYQYTPEELIESIKIMTKILST